MESIFLASFRSAGKLPFSRKACIVTLQSSSLDRALFNGTLLWTRDNLREARERTSLLESRIQLLEEELQTARSIPLSGVQDNMLCLARERDDARAEVYALSNALSASRADVARHAESERNLEVCMYRLSKGVSEINKEVDHLRHMDSMKQVELDAYKFTLTNLQLDYKKLSAEYDHLDEARDAVVNEYEEASACVEGIILFHRV